MKVIKRDGSIEKFSKTKIRKSLMKTFKSCKTKFCQECYDDIIKNLIEKYNAIDGDTLDINNIQDIIETTLVNCDLPDVAKAYILYRHERDRIREFVKQKEQFIESYKTAYNTADNTIDDNSNVTNKNIGVLNSEIHKPDNIQINRTIITNKLHKLFPDFDAKQYCRDLDDHVIYKNDESSFACTSPYCCSITMYPFLLNGIKDIGGLSARPKNLDSFCGMYVNLVLALSTQFAGACMHKDQKLYIKKDGVTRHISAKNFVLENLNGVTNTFENYQGVWEYANVNDIQVAEDGKFVNVKKVYRRKYNDDIYIIRTKDGRTAKVSKDHKFKVMYKNRIIEVKAKDLVENDTVFVNKDFSYIIENISDDYKKGWIKGILCGDGCITRENEVRLNVHSDQTYYANIFNDYSSSIYGNSLTTIRKDNRGKCMDYSKYNNEFYKNVCTDIIGNNTYDKHIDVTNKSIDFLLGFIDGLLCADGSYTKSRGVTISLTNHELIENVADIISIMGYEKPSINKIDGKGNRKESYSVYIRSTFLKYLKHTHLKKLELDNIGDARMNEVSIYGANALKNAKSSKRNKWSNSHRKEQYMLDVIDSIDVFKNDDEYVYEIETESHWYNCGGFITHNCATSEVLLYFDYFARKEWGDDYIDKADLQCKSEVCLNPRTIRQQIHQHFQQIIYSINQPSRSSMQSPFVNFSYFDKPFFEGMFGEFVFPDGTKPIWKTLSWLQKEFMTWFNEERLKTVLTFPVESFALVYKDGDFVDKETYQFVCDEYARGHSFFTYISDTVDSLSSCCRLKNMVQTKEFNFTNGNMGLMTGSKSVISLNLSRIVQNAVKGFDNPQDRLEKDAIYDAIKKYLIEILERVYKYHYAYNELLWDMYDARLLPAYSAHFIDLNKQYLTIGLNGLNQAAEFLGLKCTNNKHYAEFCQMIFSTVKEQNKLHKTEKTTFNTEQVPAESLAVKNYKWDKEDGYWVPEDTNLYASYIFKPNDKSVSVLDKIVMHGKNYIGDYLDGGAAAHINLEEHLSSTQYDRVLRHAAKNGCQYLTFNIPISRCDDCGKIVNRPVDKCPDCGSDKITTITRIIGYLTAVKNWSEGRRKEFTTRVFNTQIDKPEK